MRSRISAGRLSRVKAHTSSREACSFRVKRRSIGRSSYWSVALGATVAGGEGVCNPTAGSELLQQPIDVIQFHLRPRAFGTAAAELLLDRLGALALALLRHGHIGTFIGA